MATGSLGTKTHLSAEKAAEVSPLQQLSLWSMGRQEGWEDPQGQVPSASERADSHRATSMWARSLQQVAALQAAGAEGGKGEVYYVHV